MQENEYKILINETKFTNLLERLKMDEYIEQINYYYDTSNYSFYHQGLTFRIRDLLNRKVLQVKYPNISGTDFSSRIEKEFTIDEIPLEITKYDTCKYISDMVINNDIKLLGSLKTYRWLKRLENNILLYLDKNIYLGILDYEVELEFDYYSTDITYILNNLGIQPENTKGKYSRFIEQYLKFQELGK